MQLFKSISRHLLDIRLLPWLCAAPLTVLCLLFAWQGYFEDGSGDIRVAVPREFSRNTPWTPFGPGFERELVERFATRNSLRVVWIPVDSPGEAVRLLARNKADVWLALGDQPAPDSLLARDLIPGPIYARSPVVLLQHRSDNATDSEACPTTSLGSTATSLNRVFPLRVSGRNCPAPPHRGPDWSLVPVLEDLDSGAVPVAVADERKFLPLRPFFPNIETAQRLDVALAYRWFWGEHRRDLARKLNLFWREIMASGELANLNERYYGFLPEEEDYYQIDDLLDSLTTDLPKYAKTIRIAAAKNDIDPLLLVALIYHESGFDIDAVSKTGVRGLMQMTSVTRQELGIEGAGAKTEIAAGARYLRQLRDRLDEPGLEEHDAWFMTLAAYNQGLGHLRDAIRVAEELELPPQSWASLKRSYPLLAGTKYQAMLKSGQCRGYETVDLVDKVKYYHHILNGLIFLGRPEGEHLAALSPLAGNAAAERPGPSGRGRSLAQVTR